MGTGESMIVSSRSSKKNLVAFPVAPRLYTTVASYSLFRLFLLRCSSTSKGFQIGCPLK